MRERGYIATDKMRDLIRDNSMLLMAISRFDIAFGFGDSTVGAVCADNGVDTDTFLAVCNLLAGHQATPQTISLPSLMAYLKRAHTTFLDITLPKIRHRLIEAINYTDTDDVSFQLIKFYDDYVVEVRRHMEHENNTVFAYVDGLIEGRVDDKFSISRFSVNHSHMTTKLNELKDIFIYHYCRKDNARLSAALFDIMMCERDLMTHFDVESRLFVPAVQQLENTLRSQLGTTDEDADEPDADHTPDILGEREKEIISCIARGMANKEIADTLCLSVHTVATHRRNISAKLGIHSTAGLIIFAIIHRLVDPSTVKPR